MCLRFDISPSFINGSASALLRYLQEPSLKQLCSGQLLRQIVVQIVEPPTFWNAFFQAHRDRTLDERATQCFGWLLLQLLSLPDHQTPPYKDVAWIVTNDNSLLESPSLETRVIGQKIKHALQTLTCSGFQDDECSPGGRHDNDFVNFRQILILPSPDELSANEPPFLRHASDVMATNPQDRASVHLDNQFRLLREDMLGELRMDLQVAQKTTRKRSRKTFVLDGLLLYGVECGTSSRRKFCCLALRCQKDLPQLHGVKPSNRKEYITNNRQFLKHQSVGCLVSGEQIVGFAMIDRNEDLLAMLPPIVALQFLNEASFTRALLATKESANLQLVQVDTPLFAYEPVLRRLQEKNELQLSEEILGLDSSPASYEPTIQLTGVIEEITRDPSQDFQQLFQTTTSVRLDTSQVESLLAGLTQRVSLIQGPPGTGKSFLGALLAKIQYHRTLQTILVVCYTNHALDQFLEDLLTIGIPAVDMVRLGGKSTNATKCLSLREQTTSYRRRKNSWGLINNLKDQANDLEQTLQRAITNYRDHGISKTEILEYLEFPPEDPAFHEAFSIPEEATDGMVKVGKKGKAVNPFYLLNRWMSGHDAGMFRRESPGASKVWKMPVSNRHESVVRWKAAILQERASKICSSMKDFNNRTEQLDTLFNEKYAAIIKDKRIIGCTTTAAAKYSREVQIASPDIILVEEAGEILESHVITAMGPETKQLVLIGDHKQLRPKVNNYDLSVEKGQGYDLNRSLFERLVLRGSSLCTLSEQHRMCPEISSLVRHLTYPDLQDAKGTLNRPSLRGFQDKIVFVNHDHPEDDVSEVADRRDGGSTTSKRNQFEVDMVLKCVRYLGQQGYGTDKIVLLTPYLGQLHLLRETLGKDHDPILNDLDSYDLVRAGLLPAATANLSKRPIRISTIDNYQGEESHIIIASLTRSNPSGEIGWMAAPERLNVLLSRARDALVMIGNAQTFLTARKGQATWAPLFELLKKGGHVYDGFPVKCERHPERRSILGRVEDFDEACPDGGCSEPCGTKLSCGIHDCPQRCHQLFDHSKMSCPEIMQSKCLQGHKQSWKCGENPPKQCRKCEAEAIAREKRIQRDHELELKREAKQRQYRQQIEALDEEIELKRQMLRNQEMEDETALTLEKKKQDLENVKALAHRVASARMAAQNQAPPAKTLFQNYQQATFSANTPADGPSRPLDVSCPQQSPAKDEWEHQKRTENVNNEAIDSLMEMIGLEDLKGRFLNIKAKVDTVLRQNTDLKNERFGAALLGNPGTGKTTVARLYAKLLTSFGVIPGDEFIETTGSRLANEGVAGVKKHIEELLKAGGGALFLDEAYQLVASQNYSGSQVLDFLLAEMENQTGKIVFILAGYNKQMEAFFEHNPGLTSRIPHRLQFADYDDDELVRILRQLIAKKYKGQMKVEGGLDGLFIRILARRVGRGRGHEGFGNARAVQNNFSRVTDNQAQRLRQERRCKADTDDFWFSKEDLIGPEPSKAIDKNPAWIKLQELIGLPSVKESVRCLLDRLQLNYCRELEEKPLVECSLNRVFLGSPGTGKTSVAKLYGQILADIGLLSNGEVIVKSPADFVGSHLGHSESNTKAILASTIGKVLIIDEAYMLYSGSAAGGNQADPFKTAVIDTIVAEVQSVAGDDRCVLLLGYRDQMEDMFQNVNPGLSRRFPMESAFEFEDFTDAELAKILELKLRQQGFSASDLAKRVAMDVLGRARNRPNFGNAGEVDILLDRAKAVHQARFTAEQSKSPDAFDPEDFDKDFDRGKRAATNCRKLFEDVVGHDALISKLEGYQQIVQSMRERGFDPKEQIPFNFLFKGPPGTGKTTTARKMGKVFYDMGFLSTAQVEECSATDLIGQYVGQTGPKVLKLLDKALGRVLFIDEAYRLAEGQFGLEAVNELVDCLTKSRFAGKLVTILAGYDADINRLISVNPGLSSRFPEEIIFDNLSPEHCLQLLGETLKRKKIDDAVLNDLSPTVRCDILDLFGQLSSLPSWGNARDVQHLAKAIFSSVLKDTTAPEAPLILSEGALLQAMRTMVCERRHRATNVQESVGSVQLPTLAQTPGPPSKAPPPNTQAEPTVVEAAEQHGHDEPITETPADAPVTTVSKDAGVSNEIWQQLAKDKESAERSIQQEQGRLSDLETELQKAASHERQMNVEVAKSNFPTNTADEHNQEKIAEQKRKQEGARLAEVNARLQRERALQELEDARRIAEAKKRQEAAVQAKLRKMGVCVAGYQWIKQSSGYRCAGGSHFIGNEQLGL